ncbi:Small, acid-soluble spore protein, alpha/beta type [compost metagenome]
MAKKKQKIMIPEAAEKMQEMRYEIAKKLGFIVADSENWWESLSRMQQSEVNGIVTKFMIENARRDMRKGLFPYK